MRILWLLMALWGCGEPAGGYSPPPQAGSSPPSVPGPTPPVYELDGSWFVRYASDPKPYLDVAFRGDQRPVRVTATLQGPGRAWPDLELSWNARDAEWQIVCTFLPDPLPGGWWFVSAVTAFDAGGEATAWRSKAPSTPYGGDVQPGFYYAAESGSLRWRVETFAAEAPHADPILRVVRADAPHRWVAANDDWDVGQPWAAVTFPVEPGASYLVRVYGEDDDAGHYAIRAAPEGAAAPRVSEGAAPPGAFEGAAAPKVSEDAAAPKVSEGAAPRPVPRSAPDAGERPADALTLSPNVALRGELAGDVDWFRFDVPR